MGDVEREVEVSLVREGIVLVFEGVKEKVGL